MHVTSQPAPIVLHGPGGVGKDYVVDQLTTIPRLMSVTDRAPRPDEEDGVHYYFVHEAVFQTLIECGAFAEHAPVLGYRKGITRRVVEQAIASGKDFIIRTDIQGAATWRQRLAGCVTVRLLGLDPARPVREHREDLINRLLLRGASEEEIANRTAELQIEYVAGDDDYTVVNPWGRSEEAVAQIHRILAFERTNPARPAPRILP